MSKCSRRAACAIVLALLLFVPGLEEGQAQQRRKELPSQKISRHLADVDPALFTTVEPGTSFTYRVELKPRRAFVASNGDGVAVTTQGNVAVVASRLVSSTVYEVDFVSLDNGLPGLADIRIEFTTPKGKLRFIPGGVAVGGDSLVAISSVERLPIGSVQVGPLPFGIATGGPNSTTAGRVFVCNSGGVTVSVVQLGTLDVIADVLVGSNPQQVVVIGPVGAQFAYVTNFGSDTVSVIDVEDLRVLATIPVGDGPIGIAAAGPGGFESVYVANRDSDTVSVIDARLNVVVATIPVGDGPTGLGVTGPVGAQTLIVTEQFANTVALVSVSANAVVNRVAVGLRPVYVAVGGVNDRFAVVVNQLSGTVSILDILDVRLVGTVAAGNVPLGAVVVGPSVTPNAYIANNADGLITVVSLTELRVLDSIFIGGRPRGVHAVGAEGSEIVLATN